MESNKDLYERDGYLLIRGLFPASEVAAIKDRFERIWNEGVPGYFERRGDTYVNNCDSNYPRIIHPHRFDALSRSYLIDPRILDVVEELLSDEAIAAQTMYYWKPPGTKGQAPHQDNLYLQADDAEGCRAAWIAIDDCDEENGCLIAVPGSHKLDLKCPAQADPEQFFSSHFVEKPEGYREVPIRMKAGDCFFFGGHTIHGSNPNSSHTRCRRSFICHYIGGRSTMSAGFYNPLIRRNGEEFDNTESTMGSPCGVGFDGPH